MSNDKYRIVGRVVDRRTRRGVCNLRVEAWDLDTRYHDMLGVAATDVEGNFTIRFTSEYFGDFAPDRAPDLFFRVFRGPELIKTTQAEPLSNVDPGETKVIIEVDMPQAVQAGPDRLSAFQVRQGVIFLRKTDYRGLWGEAKDRAGLFGGLVADLLKAGLAGSELAPLKAPSVRTNAVINQDVTSARKNLEAQQVTVQEVKPYQPDRTAEGLEPLAGFPMRVKPGDRVVLYETQGQVKAYSVVRARQPAVTVGGADLDRELSAIRADLDASKEQLAQRDQEIAVLKQQMSAVGEQERKLTEFQARIVEMEKLIRERPN